MSQPGFFFYTGDWLKDTRILSAEARGCWADALCFLNEAGGSVCWPLISYARFWGVSEAQARTILDEIAMANVGNVEWQNDSKTLAKLSNRRILRDTEKRNETKKVRAEAGKKGAAKRWQKCASSSPSPSPSLFKSQKDIYVEPPDLSVQDLVDSWNESFKGKLPQVEWPLSTSRQRKAAARLREHKNLEFWQQVFNNLVVSDFLMGKNNGTWRCTLDFLIANDTNCIKVYEGAYNGKTNQTYGH